MKNKIAFFPVMLLILLGILVLGAQTGCNKTDTTLTFNTTALRMSFVENAPPSQISSGTPMAIYVKAENVGDYTIAPGTAKFYLSGIANNLKNVNLVLVNLQSLTPVQQGGFEIIKFADRAEPTFPIVDSYNLTMKADACYTYATITQATICVGPGSSICSISGEKIVTGANSNAPIQITSLTEQVQGSKLTISFSIINKGSGTVYYTDLDCDKLFGPDLSEAVRQDLKKNMVEIYIETEPDISCTLQSESGTIPGSIQGRAPVIVSGAAGKVTCTKTIGTETHSAIMKMTMGYKYVEGLSKSIMILPA